VSLRHWSLLALLLALPAAGAMAVAPVLGINAPGHSGKTFNVAVTPDERFAVTVSYDKSIRIWDVASGQLLRRWTIPVLDADDGLMRAAALSPDGEVIAVGGQLRGLGEGLGVGRSRLRDGRGLRVIGGLNGGIGALAWSPDGRYFAIGFAGGQENLKQERGDAGDLIAAAISGSFVVEDGFRVYDTRRWDSPVLESSFEGRVTALGFSRSGDFFALGDYTTQGSDLRVFRREGEQFVSAGTRQFAKAGERAAAWSDDGKFIYVGGEAMIEVSGMRDVMWAGERTMGGPSAAESGMHRFREARGSTELLAASYLVHDKTGFVRRYADRSRPGNFRNWSVPDPRITDFAVLGDGRVLYVSDIGTVAMLGASGDLLWRTPSSAGAFESAPEALRVSADGRWISLLANGTTPIAFNLFEPRFSSVDSVSDWLDPATRSSELILRAWQGTSSGSASGFYFPKFDRGEKALCVAVPAQGRSFIYGSDAGRVYKVAVQAGRPWAGSTAQALKDWWREFSVPVTAVHLIESRGLVVVATSDNAIRLLEWSTGKTVLTYLVDPASRKWVAVADSGYYEAGIGSEDLAGWIVNRDAGRVADFFPLSRFREPYLLPGLADAVLGAGRQDDGIRKLLVGRQQARAGDAAGGDAAADAARQQQVLAKAEAVRRAEAERAAAEAQAVAARREGGGWKLAAAEAEAGGRAAEGGRKEEGRQAALRQQEEKARIEADLARQVEAARIALEQTKQEEARKVQAINQAEAAREAERKRQETLRLAEAERQGKETGDGIEAGGGLVEAARKAEEGGRQAGLRLAEEQRLAALAQQAEAARQAELARLETLQKAEQARQHAAEVARAELERLNAAAAAATVVAVQSAPSVDRLPPVVDVLSPGFDVATSDKTLSVRYRVNTPEGAPVLRVRGRVVTGSQATRAPVAEQQGNDEQEIRFELPTEDAEIQLVAENRWGPSVPAVIRVRWQGARPAAGKTKGTLHVVAVGVSEYDNPDYRLGYAAKDARDFAGEIRKQEGGLYAAVKLYVLTDRDAAKTGIESAFEQLRRQVAPKDTTMVFLAGHGINDASGEYLYLPREANLSQLKETGVSFRKLGDLLASLPGRTVMFVDTCHSGNVVNRLGAGQSQNNVAAVNELASSEKNIIVFASSTGDQASLEHDSWGNGAFTKALLEGFGGKADFLKRGRVTYKQLDAYVSDRVDELTSGKQTPVTPVLVTVPDFTLAEVRK